PTLCGLFGLRIAGAVLAGQSALRFRLGLEHGPFESRAFQQLADPGVGPPLPSKLDGQVDRAEVPAARRAVGPDIATLGQAAATPGAGVLARAVLREGLVAVEEAEGVVPGDVLVGVGLPRGLVHRRLA